MFQPQTSDEACRAAVALLSQADALLITAGAGMGIDSGLPDFRGDQGFWQAYPALGKQGLSFIEIANPRSFKTMPQLAWGFYGHRLHLYRQTLPHKGFELLRTLARTRKLPTFVFTSNVDGQFQKAGFQADQIEECHGSIHHMQCLAQCGQAVWRADDFNPEVDEHSCELISALPTCPSCGGLARPNILMFGDYSWDSTRTDWQQINFKMWLNRVKLPVVIELGAGQAIATVRHLGESLRCPLIRLNPTESGIDDATHVGIATGALAGITRICELLDAGNAP